LEHFKDQGRLIKETKILDTISTVLGAVSSDEETVYYMKLEALWILTNICYTDDNQILFLITTGTLTPIEKVDESLTHTSSVFDLVNAVFSELVRGNAQDVKTFTSVLHMIGNLLSIEPTAPNKHDILRVVMKGSSLISCIYEFVTKNPKLDGDAVELICWVLYAGTQTADLPPETLSLLKMICLICVKTDNLQCLTNLVKAIGNICLYYRSYIGTLCD
jgi:hypothetical protein